MLHHPISSSPAMNAAFDALDRAFGDAAEIEQFKRRVRRVLREPDHLDVAHRYGSWIAGLSEAVAIWTAGNTARKRACTLSTGQPPVMAIAINLTERAYGEARDAMQRGGIRLPYEILREMRLILRWMRRAGKLHAYSFIEMPGNRKSYRWMPKEAQL